MYKLVKISPIGRRSDVATDFKPDGLIAVGEVMQKKFPKEQFGVVDEYGFFEWPERLAKAHVNPKQFLPTLVSFVSMLGRAQNFPLPRLLLDIP